MSFLKPYFKHIKENRKYIYFSTIIFVLFSFIGFFFPILREEILKIIAELSLMFEGLNLIQTTGLIFFNNARASLLAIVLGIFIGFFPLVILISNGYVIGFVMRIVSEEKSIFEFWRLLPHGIFELPAVIISIGLGLKLGLIVLNGANKKTFFNTLNKSLKTFVVIIVPLLIIAAIIEGLLIFYF